MQARKDARPADTAVIKNKAAIHCMLMPFSRSAVSRVRLSWDTAT